MSFDIYGNNLRSGHCEVHPNVHEEYPCSQCFMERQREDHRQAENDRQRAEEYDRQQEVAWLRELAHDAENIFGELVGDRDYDIIEWRRKYQMIVQPEKAASNGN